MDWLDDVIAKLEKARDLLDTLKDKGADSLRQAADLLRLLAEAADKGAGVIDPTPGASVAACAAGRERLTALLKSFEDRQFSATGSVPWEIIIPVIAELIRELIRRKFPNPTP